MFLVELKMLMYSLDIDITKRNLLKIMHMQMRLSVHNFEK